MVPTWTRKPKKGKSQGIFRKILEKQFENWKMEKILERDIVKSEKMVILEIELYHTLKHTTLKRYWKMEKIVKSRGNLSVIRSGEPWLSDRLPFAVKQVRTKPWLK